MHGTFPRKIEALEQVFDLVGTFSESHEVSDKARLALDFVVEELFTNMVKYNDGKADIEVRIDKDADTLSLELVDHGVEPFDPFKDAPTVDTGKPIEERTPGGLGLHLVKSMVDDLTYEYTDGDIRIVATKVLEA